MGPFGDSRARGLSRAVERGGRVFLRYPELADEEEYVDLRRRSADFHRPWEPAAPEGHDPYAGGAFRRYTERARSERYDCLLLCRVEDGAIMGAFNLSEIVRGAFQSAFLGYWIGQPYARQGYMREGLALELDHAFGRIGLHRVEANIQPTNAASIALARGAGFRLEGYSPRYLEIAGRWRDHERWALLADEHRLRGEGRPGLAGEVPGERPGEPA